MTVKELREKLSTMPPDANVIVFDTIHRDDFYIHNVTADKVIDDGMNDGFTKEYRLSKFLCYEESLCSRFPVGTEFVVLH